MLNVSEVMIAFAAKTNPCTLYILWQVDPLLGNDHEIRSCTTVATRQQPVNSDGGTVFSVRSLPRSYNHDKLGVDLVGW
jgi:hypothetical protein